ncbi:MAG: DM13 domain-containing protein [Planctomycetota bacterium]
MNRVARSLLAVAVLCIVVSGVASGVARAQEVLYSSSIWFEGREEISGAYRIVRAEEGLLLELSRSFRTKDAPDLKVVLSPHRMEDSARSAGSQASNRNALEGGLVLGLLSSSRGAARFEIPAGTDFTRYRSVLIHCEEYSLVWGGADLVEGRLVHAGSSWVRKTNRIRGRWEIVAAGNTVRVRTGEDFDTRNAPDLKFVLSPRSASDNTDRTALQGGRILGLLSDHEKAQEVTVSGVDLSGFRSLLIHCQQYTKLWGGAELGGFEF